MRYDEAIQQRLLIGSNARVRGQSISGTTGTMAAGLAASAACFGFRYPAAGSGVFLPQWMHVHYECLGSFTTANTPGRRLGLRRGSGGDFTSGTTLDVTLDASAGDPQWPEAQVAGKVSTTAALGVVGITLEGTNIRRISLATKGQAGQDYDELWDLQGLELNPGELIAVVAGQTFDVVGTWQASFKSWGFEVV
jgi:hypothetical protein